MTTPLPPELSPLADGVTVAPSIALFPPYQSTAPPQTPYTAAFGTTAAGSATGAQTLIHNVAAGDALVVAAQSNSTSTYALSCADSQNNKYTLVFLDINRSPNLALFVCFVKNPLTANVDSITVTYAGTATVKNMIVRGNSGFVSVDVISNPGDGSSTSPSNFLPALGATGDWVVAGLSNGTGAGMPVSWSGASQDVSIGPGPFLTTADLTTSSTAPQTISATLASSSTWVLGIVSLSPVPLYTQTATLLIPPGLDNPASINLVVPSASPPGNNIGGVSASVSVFGQSDNSVTESVPGPASGVNVSGQSDNTVADFVTGSAASVNVSGQVDNTIVASVSGAVTNVNAAAQSGTTGGTYSAPPANVNVAGIAGSILEIITGTTATVNASGPVGTVADFIIGSTANINSAGISGSIVVAISTTPGSVNVVAPPGSFPTPINVTGSPASVTVMAPSGIVFKEPDGTWWRVYPAYRSYPT